VEYNENASRDAKKKGAKAGGGTIMIAISSGAKAKDAAAKLRAGFNKMKDSGDELAKLAAFLIDALDDAGSSPTKSNPSNQHHPSDPASAGFFFRPDFP
jgi:hypothetical protein